MSAPEPTTAPEPKSRGATPSEIAWRGIELCRQDDWTEGLYWLKLAFDASDRGRGLPALAFGYFGYGLARYQRKAREGFKLCQRGVKLEFYQPEGFVLLARSALLTGDRSSASEAVSQGLALDDENTALLELQRQLGERRPPVLGFLSRRHPVNRLLGSLRHGLSGRRPAAEPAPASARPRGPAGGGKAPSPPEV